MVKLYSFYTYPDKKQKVKAKDVERAAKKLWRQDKTVTLIQLYDEQNNLYRFRPNDWMNPKLNKFKSKPKLNF